jgi:hypothetical protein
MELDEAIKKLNAAGLIVEDTDELDDADLPVGMNAKEYHKQKAKMMSLLDKVQMALNGQSDKAQAEVEEIIPPEVKKYIKELEQSHKSTFSGDYKGDWFMNTKNVEGAKKQHKFKDESETLLWCFVQGMKKHGLDTSYHANDYKKRFTKNWLPLASKLIKGEKVKVFRGMCFYESDLEDDFKKIAATFTKNVLSRNSWTFNKKVAKDYASDASCGVIVSMDCSLDQTNLYYSAWLEGYWAGYGSMYTQGSGNDEINLKQMMRISNIKVEHYNPDNSYSAKLYKKYFGKIK